MATDTDQLLEEKPIPPALRRQLHQCFERAKALTEGQKIDRNYANTMFTQCVVSDPGNLVYVEAFLDNLAQMYNDDKRGKRVGGRGPFKRALAKKDWLQALKQGPLLLKSNPWDVHTLRGMADACEAYGYHEAELRYLKNALDGSPKDINVNKHCGTALARVGQFDQAIACWHRAEEIKPSDKEATKMVSLLTEDKARVASGLPPKAVKLATRRRPADEDGAQQQTEESGSEGQTSARREIELTPRQQLERTIEEFPAKVDAYMELAELLQGEDRHADAIKVLTKAQAATGNNLKIREQLEDAEIGRMRHQLSIAEKKAAHEKTEESIALAKDMKRELNRRELAVYGTRAERYPDDQQMKVELAVRLKRDGNYSEATKYLRIAREDTKVKAVATMEMGECLQHQKKFNKALQCYIRAADLAENDQDQDCQKLSLYRAGVLATGLKEIRQALDLFKKLKKIDPEYKDLRDRLDKIKKIRDKS